MSYNHYLPKGKVSLVPKKHHGFQFLLFLMGLLLPPIAVAARFGIGTDFFLNVFLCICGYFPCHFHNFYIQNIRNNTNRNRTPKWALKAGLVDNSDNERHARKNLWAKRFDERNLQSTHIGANLAEGEEGDNYDPVYNDPEEMERRRNEGLWTGAEEEYYNPDAAPNQRHWHYPANFEGAVPEGSSRAGNGRPPATNRRGSSDNFSFTNGSSGANGGSSYPSAGATDDDVPEWGKDYGSRKKNKKKFGGLMGGGGSKQNRSTVGNGGTYVDDVRRADGWGADDVGGVDDYGGSSGRGGTYGAGSGTAAGGGGAGRDDPYAINGQANGQRKQKSGDVFDHEF